MEQELKKVLIITYYWPPAGGPGVQRWLKFVKYLREYGWEPVVLTVENGVYPAIDNSLHNDIPDGVAVIRTRAGNPFRLYNLLKGNKAGQVPVALINHRKKQSLFDKLAIWIRSNCFIPDARKGWYRHAIKEIPRLMHHDQPKVVITTGPPHSTHRIGQWVANKYNIPWLADFRDPWTTVYYNHLMPRTKRTQRIDLACEEEVLRHANCILTVSEAMRQEYEGRSRRTMVIRNGFDEHDMQEATDSNDPEPRFVVLHTGNIAPNQHVPVLWDVLKEFCQRDPEFSRHLLIRLVGNVDSTTRNYLEAIGLSSNVEYTGYVSHHEATALMQGASLLLLLIPDAPGNRAIVTGKLFEYLLARAPILGMGPADGDADAILQQTGRGEMIGYNERQSVKNRVEAEYHRWLAQGRITQILPLEPCLQYSRRRATGQLASLLDELVKATA